LVIKLKPKTRAIYMRLDVLGKDAFLPFGVVGGGGVLAIWVPANAKKRNRKVPTNSPKPATILLRTVEGLLSMGSLVGDSLRAASEVKESMRGLPEGLMSMVPKTRTWRILGS
jgi:hypothetical protein